MTKMHEVIQLRSVSNHSISNGAAIYGTVHSTFNIVPDGNTAKRVDTGPLLRFRVTAVT